MTPQHFRSREVILRRLEQRKNRKPNMITAADSRRAREIVSRAQKERDNRGQGRHGKIVPVPTPAHYVGSLADGSRITCITPTGDRPLAFALCQQWMKHQKRKPDQWIVVDDGKTPLTPTYAMQYVRREPRSDDPQYTLSFNLATALPLITGDKIFIIEDDDYYAPDYIAEMSRRLDSHEVVGLMHAKYYYLPTGGHQIHANATHCSLAETAFRSSFLPEMPEILRLSTESYVDLRIWIKAGARGYRFNDNEKPLYLGIKGLPGRGGIGIGHDPNRYKKRNQQDTTNRPILKKWVPKDYQVYLDIVNGKLTSENYQSYFSNDLPITGITVVQNTKNLIERAYNSIRKFYPEIPIIIIDGSDPGNPCAAYVRELASDKTTVISLGYNIGHGRGMCMGIDKTKTPYALIFDSDIEMLKPCLPEMLAMMENDTFGVGDIDKKVDFNRFVCGTHGHVEVLGKYLQPYFQLIDIRNYKKFYPYVHHGAPCYLTMLDIHKRGLSGKILKQFPDLIDGVSRFVRHDHHKTRNIEQPWVMNEGLV